MKIIHSFGVGNQNNPITHNYAWLRPEYNWLSWILSTNQAAKFYPIELYTDTLGYEILIEKLQLPYSKVHVVLDELKAYDSALWALPKLKTYELQEEPFLHIDGDVFIWDEFPKELLSQELITQNLEITTDYYGKMWKDIYPHLQFTPPEMEDYINGASNFACNMGIIGGTNLDFFHRYTKKSFEFVDKNKAAWEKINGFNFNIFFEQVLFYECAKKEQRKVSHLFQEISKDNEYVGLASFNQVPNEKTYLHLLGYYKRNFLVCKQLENYVLKHYPEYFERVLALSDEFYQAFKTQLPDLKLDKEHMQNIASNFQPTQKITSDIDIHYLLGRDLTSIGKPQQLKALLSSGENPELIKLKGWNTEATTSDEFAYIMTLQETDALNAVHFLDEIDFYILNELEFPIRYFSLKEEMIAQLDEEALEMKDQFLNMIEERIHYFVTHRILSVNV